MSEEFGYTHVGYTPSAWGIAYHTRDEHELLGAGSAGPGKTWVLLADPLRQIKIEHDRCMLAPSAEHYHPFGSSFGWALHLRRTVRMLEQTIQRTHRIFPLIDPGAKWDTQKTTWTFSSGYKFQFGHCKDLDDWEGYMSSEYTHLAFDELVQFTQEQYDQIRTRVRCADPVLAKMLRVRSMSNPMMKFAPNESVAMKGDPHWVRKRFVDPHPQGNRTLKEKFFRMDGSVGWRTRRYMPATLRDNPDKAFVAQYEETLASAKPHIRQALLFGNWYVTAGSFFADEWNDRLHVHKPFVIPSTWRLFRSMDWGYKAPGCVLWWAIDEDDNLWGVREVTFKEKSVEEVCEIVHQVEISLGTWRKGRSVLSGPADTQLWEKRGEMGESKAETFARKGIGWAPADKKSRQSNAERLTFRLKDHDGGTKTPGVVFFDCCKKCIATIPAIQTDPDNSELPADGGDDHWLDATLYGVAYASRDGVGDYMPEDDDVLDEDDMDEVREVSRGRMGYGGL